MLGRSLRAIGVAFVDMDVEADPTDATALVAGLDDDVESVVL